jgi:hypothetical protein
MGLMVGGVMQATGVSRIQAGEQDAYWKLLEDHQRTSEEEFAPEVMRLRECFQCAIGLAGGLGGCGLEQVTFWLDYAKALIDEFFVLLSAFMMKSSAFTETR